MHRRGWITSKYRTRMYVDNILDLTASTLRLWTLTTVSDNVLMTTIGNMIQLYSILSIPVLPMTCMTNLANINSISREKSKCVITKDKRNST